MTTLLACTDIAELERMLMALAVGALLLAGLVLWGLVKLWKWLRNPDPVVDWGFSCGRTYLKVAGYVVAVEGDVLRDMDLGFKMRELAKKEYANQWDVMEAYFNRDLWTGELIKFVAEQANK